MGDDRVIMEMSSRMILGSRNRSRPSRDYLCTSNPKKKKKKKKNEKNKQRKSRYVQDLPLHRIYRAKAPRFHPPLNRRSPSP